VTRKTLKAALARYAKRWTLGAPGSRFETERRAAFAQGCRTMANSQLLDILLLVMVAGFVLFKLYTVLGRRTGHERPPQDANYRFWSDPPGGQPEADDSTVVNLPPRREAQDAAPADPVARGLFDIKLADRGFETEHFLTGARQAYESVVTAFAQGDRVSLMPLLNDEVFKAFDAAITARETRGEKTQFTFVGFTDVKIVQAALKARQAEITVAFGAQFISATTNSVGAVVEGDAKSVRDVTDVWTFSRDTRARDPNWHLVATSGELP
jgi:predicted lipid-binding transport protein (Tim44 family)